MRQSHREPSTATSIVQTHAHVSDRPPSSTFQTILIVDADEVIVKFYMSIFEGRYRVIATASGHHAIALAEQTDDIHVVLLECRLNDMSGLEVLKGIKQYRPELPVIIVTAHGDEDSAVKAFRYGAKDYIKKPFSYEDLAERVDFCLSLRHIGKSARKSIYSPERHHASSKVLKDIASAQQVKIQKALRYLDRSFTSRIDLTAIAQKACLSKYHFCRTFKKAVGITCQEYVIQRRIEKAKELLKDPKRSITEVAQTLGYSDPNNLIRNFKKLTGVTPTTFRNRSGKPQQ